MQQKTVFNIDKKQLKIEYHIIDNKSANQHIRLNSDGSCDIEN